MKLIKSISLTSLMIASTSSFAGIIESNQNISPSGPYYSNNQNSMSQAYNQSMISSEMNAFEWNLKQQHLAYDNFDKMIKQNSDHYKKNEEQYAEYLKKYEKLVEKRDKNHQKWIAENNKKMMQIWKNMLDEYSEGQKQQIVAAENMPEWMKQRMLKHHELQLARMNSNPPTAVNYGYQYSQMQQGMQPMQQYSQPQMMQPMNRMQGPVPMQQAPQNSPYNGQPYSAPYNNFRH